MPFVGRTRELGRLRTALDRPEASIHRLSGLREVGKTALVRRVTGPLRSIYHRAPPLPDPDQRALLASTLGPALSSPAHKGALEPDPSWERLFAALVEAAPSEGPARIVVIDDVHRFSEARARYVAPLRRAFERARAEHRRIHLVLVGAAAGLPTHEDLAELLGEDIRLDPLGFRAAARLLPGASPIEALSAYAVFGGVPGALARLPDAGGIHFAARRALFEETGALRDWGIELLERDVQTPSRYAAILAVLARGEADWKKVHDGVRDLSASGQVAPYLKRLEELGLVRVRRSLDAAPGSRARRYRIADPLVAFWYRFVLAHRHDPRADEKRDYFGETVRPALDGHVASIFPEICRQYMEFDAMEHLASNAREAGSLWGEGYDIGVAGTLTTGAVFYGVPLWSRPPARVRHLAELDRQIRETRYGFGRERRLRILFAPHGVPRTLEREATRRDDALMVGAEELAGTA